MSAVNNRQKRFLVFFFLFQIRHWHFHETCHTTFTLHVYGMVAELQTRTTAFLRYTATFQSMKPLNIFNLGTIISLFVATWCFWIKVCSQVNRSRHRYIQTKQDIFLILRVSVSKPNQSITCAWADFHVSRWRGWWWSCSQTKGLLSWRHLKRRPWAIFQQCGDTTRYFKPKYDVSWPSLNVFHCAWTWPHQPRQGCHQKNWK